MLDLWRELPMFGFELVESIFSIVVIDLVVSGDNAVVIAMATRLLAPAKRRHAIVLGAAGAITLRVLCTALVAVLLGIPLLQAAGGLLLLWIAYKLLRQRERAHLVSEGGSLGEAVRTIILADAIMSLDNMLAVGGAAHGNIALLLFGLALSMPIIVFASGLIAGILDRLPWLLYLGAAILAYTAAGMLLEDPLVRPLYPHTAAFSWAGSALAVAGVLGLAYWRNRRHVAADCAEQKEAAHPPALPARQHDIGPLRKQRAFAGGACRRATRPDRPMSVSSSSHVHRLSHAGLIITSYTAGADDTGSEVVSGAEQQKARTCMPRSFLAGQTRTWAQVRRLGGGERTTADDGCWRIPDWRATRVAASRQLHRRGKGRHF
jgi:YjbE family integral membrane protein